MAPLATGGHYANFMTAEELWPGSGRGVRSRHAAGQRLAAPKRSYEPDNVFRLNHNIAP